MPIRRELRPLYPPHWREISNRVRFGRAGGLCERCGRPHKSRILSLPDGRWFDSLRNIWRDTRNRRVRWPDLLDVSDRCYKQVILATAHLNHDPRDNRLRNLRALCQRCHLLHDRVHHMAQRRITHRKRWATGDLFLGRYD